MSDPITGIEIVDRLFALLETHGYLVVFAATVLENLFVVGSFTPGETFVAAGGFVSSRGQLEPFGVWLSAVAGSFVGSSISYYLGFRGGRELVERWGHIFHISEKRILGAERYFEEHGSKTVLIARFVAGFKNFVPVLAGISRMRLAVFEAYVLIGAAIYAAVMVTVGYVFGDNLDKVLGLLESLGYAGLALIAALVVAWFLVRRKMQKAVIDDDAKE